MIMLMAGLGVDIEKEREKYLPKDFIRFQFTSKRKKMATVLEHIKDNEHDYDKRCHMKGASEIVLRSCTKYLDTDGTVKELDNTKRNELLETIEEYAKKALRTICLACKDLKDHEGGPEHDNMAEDNV